jgi:hypothetical protein
MLNRLWRLNFQQSPLQNLKSVSVLSILLLLLLWFQHQGQDQYHSQYHNQTQRLLHKVHQVLLQHPHHKYLRHPHHKHFRRLLLWLQTQALRMLHSYSQFLQIMVQHFLHSNRQLHLRAHRHSHFRLYNQVQRILHKHSKAVLSIPLQQHPPQSILPAKRLKRARFMSRMSP